MIKVPVVLDREPKVTIGMMEIDETQLPADFNWHFVCAHRVTECSLDANGRPTITRAELVELLVSRIPARDTGELRA